MAMTTMAVVNTPAVTMKSLEKSVRAWLQRLGLVMGDLAAVERRQLLLEKACKGMEGVRAARVKVIAR
jgi:hypothetical protein